MATKKTILVEVDLDQAIKEVDKLKNSLEKVTDEVKDVGDTADKEIDKVGSSAKKSSKGVGTMSTAFKGLGTAMKAAGIGLIIAAVAALGSVLSENQVVVDKVKTAWEAVSIVLHDFVNFIINNAQPTWDKMKTFFDDLTFDKVGEAIKKNLIERFESLIDTFGYVWEAIKKITSGDFSGAWDSLKDAGKESIDVFTGVNNTFDKTVEVLETVVESVKSYTDEVLKTAAVNIQLEKSALIAIATQAQLIEIYDRAAEQQRQIRDDESKSVEERIIANDKLLEVLDKQEKAMLSTAEAQIANAQAQYKKNASDENYIALIDAQTNKLGVLAQVEGFRSEQKVNEVALDKELLELSTSKAESDAQLAIDAKRFAAEKITDEDLRIQKLWEVLEEEKLVEQERLQLIIDSTTAGTQARVDAEIEYNTRMQELDQQTYEFKADNTLKQIQLKDDIVGASFGALDALVNIFGQESKLGKAVLVSKQLAAAAEIAIGISKIKFKATQTLAEASLDAGKTGTSIATGTAVTLSAGFPAAIPLLIGYAAAAVGVVSGIMSAFKTTKSITSKYGATGGASPKIDKPAVSTPSFNMVGTSGENQLAQTVAENNQEPIKAYVVSTEMSEQQEMDRTVEETASFG